ncbi:UAA-domain-containing protein [Xylona heveae TC161]|uniref:UAA-domain-containing protein n=1 Tax=Xylona heveae (strain CBS 132557 / TC161) TaxID=1328760 RepID=A0A165HQ26_XYLHT|nr:UAA-domain-containing protein [Xylona heveae TC161]KZF23821.1 UAA-domain-containing protein [Xylona heveae TC161]
MARSRRANLLSPSAMTTAQIQRRRSAQHGLPSGAGFDGLPQTPKEINAAPSLENAQAARRQIGRLSISNAMSFANAVLHTTIPAWFNIGVMVAWIFGGCCSNVFALEAIVKEEPDSGLLMTLAQFILTALFSVRHQFTLSNPPFFLKSRAVPLRRWLVSIALFFSVNVMNNFAFGYDISVPVHIILRSGGSVTTLLAGWLWGKRFTKLQVLSVMILTVGVIISAMADAQAKGKINSEHSSHGRSFATGLVLLLIAQILSAIMGLYTQATYAKYGSHWRENMFYSHFLSIPLFFPWHVSLREQFSRLSSSRPISLASLFPSALVEKQPALQKLPSVPLQLALLAVNSLTQYACIKGVNLLAGRSSALTVTIVLNIRKLTSLMLSIWLFGNNLAPGVLLGAIVVFAAGGLYGWESQRAKSKEEKGGKEDSKKKQ